MKQKYTVEQYTHLLIDLSKCGGLMEVWWISLKVWWLSEVVVAQCSCGGSKVRDTVH